MADIAKYDIVIVGGGISGLYTAWRLACNTSYSIAVLEYSDRFGGRYRTRRMPGGFPADLGAMRYNHEEHPILHKLVEEMGIRTEPFYSQKSPFKAMFFCKGKLCHSQDEKHELYGVSKKDKCYMGQNVLMKVDLSENGNFFQATLKGSTQLARNVSMRQLWAESKNLQVTECESLFTNSSHTLAGYCGQRLSRVKDGGYGAAALAFSDGAETIIEQLVKRLNMLKVTPLSGHNVTRVEELETGFKVKAMADSSTAAWFTADKLVLACNDRGVELITWISEADRTTEIQQLLVQTNRVGVTKAAFTYNRPFWEEGGIECGKVESSILSSDFLMLGQRGKGGGYATLYIYSYSHPEIMEGLNNPDEERFENKEGDVPYDLIPSRVTVETIQRELKDIFSDVEVPDPVSTCMVDWSREPFGSGWRTPKLGVDHNAVYWKSLRPFGDGVEVYMIGDSFAAITVERALTAWTEGALLTAERVLHRYFKLEPYLEGLCLDNPWPEDS